MTDEALSLKIPLRSISAGTTGVNRRSLLMVLMSLVSIGGVLMA